jgi:F0F1-type ATP synthase assembly protein I
VRRAASKRHICSRQDSGLKNLFDFKKNRVWAENLSIIMQLGLTMAGCIMFCFFIGYFLDQWIGIKGLFVSIFTVLGVAGGGVTVYRQIMEIMKEKQNQDPKADSDEAGDS